MEHLLQRYQYKLNDKVDKLCGEPETSIRSVLHFTTSTKQEQEESKYCGEYKFCSSSSAMTKPGASEVDIPNLIRADSSKSDYNNFASQNEEGTNAATTPSDGFSSHESQVGNGSSRRHQVQKGGGAEWNQSEYFCDDRSPCQTSVQPSPMSDIATPPTNIGALDLKNTPTILSLPASALTQSPTSVSTDGSALMQQQPQLYSAIGSLEDPTTNSLTRWNQEQAATTSKYEFPSNTLLKPMNVMKQRNNGFDSWNKTPKVKTSATTNARTRLARGSSTSNMNVAATEDKESAPSGIPHGNTSDASRKKPSNLKKSKQHDENGAVDPTDAKTRNDKHVTIAEQTPGKRTRSKKKKKGPLEMFRPSSDAYTPRMGKKEIKYKPAEMRTQTLSTSLGTLQRPNFRDALRRVAMILRQHIVKIEQRFENITAQSGTDTLFDEEMRNVFSEERFVSSKYKCTMVRVPMARGGMVYGLKQMRHNFEIPSENEIYEFAHQLFNSVQLSSECSIVCLIYVERLMEASKVPLLASTWRPIFMCGLLLASKVWQDLSSWNIEFASVYPQYSLDSINRLEILFLRMIKWDLYISSSCYAKYYFALRSLVEKPDFRQRYNRMVGLDSVQASEALKIERRSTLVKEEAISQLSRSM
ncbi:hypothetical protein MPSEU_000390600 [Mayamaea pseudoterrestris]|nr:hypothetical protein MPSEU_000390600 [Mayamaea pseudoterrestris]